MHLVLGSKLATLATTLFPPVGCPLALALSALRRAILFPAPFCAPPSTRLATSVMVRSICAMNCALGSKGVLVADAACWAAFVASAPRPVPWVL